MLPLLLLSAAAAAASAPAAGNWDRPPAGWNAWSVSPALHARSALARAAPGFMRPFAAAAAAALLRAPCSLLLAPRASFLAPRSLLHAACCVLRAAFQCAVSVLTLSDDARRFAFDKGVTEAGVLRNAEALVRTGLRDAGYTYVNVDDAWAGPRATDGAPTWDNTTFASGIPSLAEKVHGMNMSFGIYTDRAGKTCGGRVASLGHEALDAKTYASWGVDYVKEDSCGATHEHKGAFEQYSKFQQGINATGRPMYFSLCGWMRYYAAAGRQGIGQSWRVGTDCNSWDDFMLNSDAAAATANFAGPGAFNDVDEIGRATCNFHGSGTSGYDNKCDEAKMRTQFNLIAVVGSPLLLSFDMSNWTKPWSGPAGSIDLVTLYSNAEVLAVHQALDVNGGLTYARIAGGPTTTGGVMPGTTDSCNPTDQSQQWLSNGEGRIYSQAPGIEHWCLRQGAMSSPKPDHTQCGHLEYVWVSPCNTSCCGGDCEEYAWTATPHGTLRSRLNATAHPNDPGEDRDPGTTLTVAPEGIPDTTMAEEEFESSDPRYDTQQVRLDDGLLRIGKTGRCLSAAAPSNSSVFARKLSDGWAVLLINWAKVTQEVACDAACMAKMGYGPATNTATATDSGSAGAGGAAGGEQVAVRDLWSHSDNGTVSASDGLKYTVPGGGASVLVKLSKPPGVASNWPKKWLYSPSSPAEVAPASPLWENRIT